MISVFVSHMSMLLSGFGNSLIYIGMYPYLLAVNIKLCFQSIMIGFPFQLDKSVNLLEYGMVVAADAFAQMILSPLLGIVIDKLKSVRLVCMVLSLLFTGDDADLLYPWHYNILLC